MIEETGKDNGRRVGRVIEVDKQSWEADQAKFMWVMVDLPIDIPLRRGGYITNAKGENSKLRSNMRDITNSGLHSNIYMMPTMV